MKTTININGSEVEIELTEEQVKHITEASKPKLFGYEKGDTYRVTSFTIKESQNGNENVSLKYGRYRRTKEAAEMDLRRQTRMMRLSALAWEVGECKDYQKNEGAYFVFYESGIWDYSFTTCHYPEVVLMTEETAFKVCKMLNSGEYSLDVD